MGAELVEERVIGAVDCFAAEPGMELGLDDANPPGARELLSGLLMRGPDRLLSRLALQPIRDR